MKIMNVKAQRKLLSFVDAKQQFSHFGVTFKFLFKYIYTNWHFWVLTMVLVPILIAIYNYFIKVIDDTTGYNVSSTNFGRDMLARSFQWVAIIISLFYIPIMMNALFSSSLNQIFYVNHVKKIYIAIALFLINMLSILITMPHAIWIVAIIFNKTFYIASGIGVNFSQLIYSLIVTVIFDSTLAVLLCFFIKSRMWLLIINLIIIIFALLLGALVVDNYNIPNNDLYYYLCLLWPPNYLTGQSEMALSASNSYYVNGLPSLNGSVFNPLDDYYVNQYYPYISINKFPAWYIWLSLFIPWSCIILGWFAIYWKRNKFWEAT